MPIADEQSMGYRVSALLHCADTGQNVLRAVESVHAQEGFPVEVVVVDDGMTHDLQATLSSCGAAVKVVRRERVGGLAVALNTAAAAASGEWLAFLGTDDLWLPHKTRLSLDVVASDPAARFVYGRAHGLDADGGEMLLGAPPPAPATERAFFLSLVRQGNAVPLVSGMVERQAFDALGGFDESLPSDADHNLWLRLAERYGVAYVDEIVAEYELRERSAVNGHDRVSALRCIHARLLAARPDDQELSAAVRQGDAELYLTRGYDRLRRSDMGGARSDFEAALAAPEVRGDAESVLRALENPDALPLDLTRLLARL